MKLDRQTILFVVGTILFMIGIAIYQLTFPPMLNGSIIDPPKPMPDFTLNTGTGPARLSDYRGKIVVLFFGYTSCADVCPLTMANLREVMTRLGSDAQNLQVVFVSVDWKRDTPEIVTNYAKKFNPNFIGMTGSQAEIDQTAKDFGIYYAFADPNPQTGFYEVEHTSSVMILDRQGNLIMIWNYGMTADQMFSDAKVLIRK